MRRACNSVELGAGRLRPIFPRRCSQMAKNPCCPPVFHASSAASASASPSAYQSTVPSCALAA